MGPKSEPFSRRIRICGSVNLFFGIFCPDVCHTGNRPQGFTGLLDPRIVLQRHHKAMAQGSSRVEYFRSPTRGILRLANCTRI